MENKQSGLVTPPIVSPRPIQTQKPFSADESWKIVGSPPRRPLLSPPEEHEREREHEQRRERARSFHDGLDSAALTDSDTSQPQLDDPTANNAPFLYSDPSDLTDSVVSSVSLGTGTESLSSSSSSSASSTSTPASPTTPQHKQPPPHRIQTGPLLHKTAAVGSPSTLESPRSKYDLSLSALTSPFALDPSLTPQQLHFKSSSTGTIGSRTATLNGPLSPIVGDNRFADGISLNDRGPTAGAPRGSLKQNGGGLESSVSLSSIWSGPSTDSNAAIITAGPSKGAIRTRDSLFALPPPRPVDNGSFGAIRTGRSLSFSEPSFSFAHSSANSTLDLDEEDMLRYRPPLPTMEEESEDSFEPRMIRARSFSTSAAQGSAFFSAGYPAASLGDMRVQDLFSRSQVPFSESSSTAQERVSLHRKLSGGLSSWSTSSSGQEELSLNHRRSLTSTSGYQSGIWENTGPYQSHIVRDQVGERTVTPRRFSLEPSTGYQPFDSILENETVGPLTPNSGYSRMENEQGYHHQTPRRHSVAGPSGSYLRQSPAPFNLSTSLETLQLDECDSHAWKGEDDPYETEDYMHHRSVPGERNRGLALSELPNRGALYVVEFKAGRSDLFYVTEDSGLALQIGDYVMVEADRGKDLGKITNDSITPEQIKVLQARQAEIAALQALQDGSGGGHRAPKDIQPKRIFRMAHPSEISLLAIKDQDELKAMVICQTKVRHKRLPMEVVNAEYQWDRRKLTFYFVAKRRIDFRELVRDLFKIYKTRIWMYAVNPTSVQNNGNSGGPQLSHSPPPHLSTSFQSGNPPSSANSPSSPHPRRQSLSSPLSPMSPFYYSSYAQDTNVSQQSCPLPLHHQQHQQTGNVPLRCSQQQQQQQQTMSYPQYPQMPLHFQSQTLKQHPFSQSSHQQTSALSPQSPQTRFQPTHVQQQQQQQQQHSHFGFSPTSL